MSLPQRRRWERYRKQLDAIVEGGPGASDVRITTVDICEGGLGLFSPQPFAVGERLRIRAPDLAEGPIVGTVRWSTAVPARGGFAIGLELTDVTANQAGTIRDSIERWKAADAADV